MYQGRFAPSPSGRLHGGSLLTSLSATLRALSQHGHCLTRIEDLDFPRCEPFLTPLMLQELALLGLFPFNALTSSNALSCDLAIQSHDLPVYKQAIGQLYLNKVAYCCNCTRAELKLRPCNCATKHLSLAQALTQDNLNLNTQSYSQDKTVLTATTAQGLQEPAQQSLSSKLEQIADLATKEQYVLRIELDKYLQMQSCASFHDELLGTVLQPQNNTLASSLVIQRRDGIIAYNLAVVVDEHRQGITEVVRGADLLETTFLQLALYEIFGYTPPKFLHVPLLLDRHGHKLSKQNHAPAIFGTLLPHQATVQAALQLNQTLSPCALEILHEQQSLSQQASHIIFKHLEAEKATLDHSEANTYGLVDFFDLSCLGQDYRHKQGLTNLSLNESIQNDYDLLDPLLHIYVSIFLAAVSGAGKIESMLKQHISALSPCCDIKRGLEELAPPLLSWSKILTKEPEKSLQVELEQLLANYLTLQRSLINELGHNFNLQAIPHHSLAC